MEQIQNNRVITDLYRENAQFPGIALDGSDVYLCWQRFVDRHDSLMASCRRGDEVVWEREISDGGEVLDVYKRQPSACPPAAAARTPHLPAPPAAPLTATP